MAYAYGFGHGMGMGFGLGFLNFLGTVLFIIAVIWVIKLAVRGFRGSAFGGPGQAHGWHRGYGGCHGGWSGDYRGRGGHGRRSRRGRRHGGGSRGGYSGRSHGGGYGGRPQRDEAMAVARERLARSQITTEEYERLRQALNAGSGHSGAAGAEHTSAERPEGRRPRRDQAMGIARLRLASGEIDAEEFDALKRALGS